MPGIETHVARNILYIECHMAYILVLFLHSAICWSWHSTRLDNRPRSDHHVCNPNNVGRPDHGTQNLCTSDTVDDIFCIQLCRLTHAEQHRLAPTVQPIRNSNHLDKFHSCVNISPMKTIHIHITHILFKLYKGKTSRLLDFLIKLRVS